MNKLNNLNVNYLKIPKKQSRAAKNALADWVFETSVIDTV